MSNNLHIKKAKDLLKKTPLKLTNQRSKLIEILFKNGNCHFTAEEVYNKVEENGYQISLGNHL